MIAGDVNLDSKCDNQISLQYKNLLDSYDMKITNTFGTRSASGRIIDHVAVNFHDKIQIVNHTIKNNISDHNMILSQFKQVKSINVTKTFKVERTDYECLRATFESLSTKFITANKDPNILAQQLIDATQQAINTSTKTLTFKIKCTKRICEWYNLTVLKAIKRKDSITRKWRKNRQNLELKRRMKLATSKLTHTIRREKERYIEKILHNKDTKIIWRNLNGLLGRKAKDKIRAITDNDEILVDEKKIAEKFNEHFVDSVTKLVNESATSSSPIEMDSVLPSIVLDNVTEEEVSTAINSLKNASPGADNIKAIHVKQISVIIAPFFKDVINTIFESGIYPDAFKTAIVIPINKSGDYSNVNDYRPISVLTTFSKIVEKIMYNRLSSFTNDHLKILYSKQFGFRKKCGTEIAAVELVDRIYSIIDNKKKASVVFMDIKKAFDTVNVSKLIEVLNKYGIRGKAQDILSSFLVNRRQIVKINNAYSSPKTFTNGVVQGSILGPYLFLLFINHISKLSTNGSLVLFADDCVLINEHAIDEPVEPKIKKDMRLVLSFLTRRGLILNTQKTNFMIFHSSYKKDDSPSEIQIVDSFNIHRVYKARYLGLNLDPHLKWDEHIDYVASKIASVSGVLWKMRRMLSKNIKKLMYQSLIESQITYLIPVWGRANDTSIKSLQVAQNRALRNVYSLDRLTNRIQMYSHLVENCLPIRSLFLLNSAALVYNITHRNIHSNITFNEVTTRTRRESYLRPHKSHSSFGSRSFAAFGPKIFNNIPYGIKKLPHVYGFKWALRCHIRKEESTAASLSSKFTATYF
jgi:hypothetical protein